MNGIPKKRGRPRYAVQDLDALRDELVGAATAIIERDGVQALTAKAVADGARIPVGTMYRVFENLETLRLAVNAITMTALRDALAAAARSSAQAEPETRLMAIAEAYVGFARANHHLWAALFQPRTGELPYAMAADVAAMFATVEGVLGEMRGLKRSEIAVATKALWASVHGMVYLGEVGGLGPIREEDIMPMVSAIVHYAVAGMTRGRA